MAYNPIAPTSSRENRKPPTNVPASAYLAADPVSGIIGFSDDASEAEYMLMEDANGLTGTETYSAGASTLARIGERVIPVTVPTE